MRSQHNLIGLNLTILFRFVDCDMLMRYHWGLGIRHTYSHTTVSQHCSAPQQSYSGGDVIEDSRFFRANDGIDERKDLTVTGMQTEQESEFEFEPEGSESDTESQSESESILGDHVDMYGPCGLDVMDEYYES